MTFAALEARAPERKQGINEPDERRICWGPEEWVSDTATIRVADFSGVRAVKGEFPTVFTCVEAMRMVGGVWMRERAWSRRTRWMVWRLSNTL